MHRGRPNGLDAVLKTRFWSTGHRRIDHTQTAREGVVIIIRSQRVRDRSDTPWRSFPELLMKQQHIFRAAYKRETHHIGVLGGKMEILEVFLRQRRHS